MSRRLTGMVAGIALAIAAAVGLTTAPASADGCGQECGTQFNQCIVQETSAAFCEDWGVGSGDCRDWGSTTCVGEED